LSDLSIGSSEDESDTSRGIPGHLDVPAGLQVIPLSPKNQHRIEPHHHQDSFHVSNI
jgi:hypothetical protein